MYTEINSFRKFFLNTRIGVKASVRQTKKFFLPDRFFTTEFVDKKYHKNIGRHTYGNPRIIDWGDGGKLKIGNFCSIAGDSTILLGGNHRADWVTTYPFPSKTDFWPEAKGIKGQSVSKGDVVIGNDVQIGHGAVILSGVTIGDGAIIGASAVVTKDVTPFSIVAGNPAKLIRLRFSDKIIKELLQIQWWNWEDAKIKENMAHLCSSNVEKFIKIANQK